MEWFAFLKCYFGILMVYYAFNLAYDLFFGVRKVRSIEDDATVYDIASLIGDETTEYVDLVEELPQETESTETAQKARLQKEEYDLQEKEVQNDQAITFDNPPIGQGIPLEQYLKDARENAKQMVKQIEFS